MGKDEGKCIYCDAVNSYNDARCAKCGEELPWANWSQARQQPSEAIGAEVGSFAKRGEVASVGAVPLPRGIIILGVLALLAMVVFYVILQKAGSSMRQVSPAGGGGMSAEKFKKANPTIQQDEKDQQENGQ